MSKQYGWQSAKLKTVTRGFMSLKITDKRQRNLPVDGVNQIFTVTKPGGAIHNPNGVTKITLNKYSGSMQEGQKIQRKHSAVFRQLINGENPNSTGLSFSMDEFKGGIGFTVIPILEFLWGKPWGELPLCWLSCFGENTVKIIKHDNGETMARGSKITVHLKEDNTIRNISYACNVGLPEDTEIRHAGDLEDITDELPGGYEVRKSVAETWGRGAR